MSRPVVALVAFVASWTCIAAAALYVCLGTSYRPWTMLAVFLGMVASGLY